MGHTGKQDERRLDVSSDPIVMLDAALQEAAKGAGVELSIEDGVMFIGY